MEASVDFVEVRGRMTVWFARCLAGHLLLIAFDRI
jgi:hypothetical protein